MVDRPTQSQEFELTQSQEFELPKDPDISINTLLSVNIEEEERIRLQNMNLSVRNQQEISIRPNEETRQTTRVRFDFLSPEDKTILTGSISLGRGKISQSSDINGMEVHFAHIKNTWRYYKNLDNPHYERSTTVSLDIPNDDPFNIPGYRRLRKRGSSWMVTDKRDQVVTDETREKTIALDARSLEICSYVLQTVRANPSLLQKVDDPEKYQDNSPK